MMKLRRQSNLADYYGSSLTVREGDKKVFKLIRQSEKGQKVVKIKTLE